jgi:5-amino-6-(5-phosphoribosylamino)uracil reductase
VQLRRLFPDEATVTVEEATAGLRFSERAPADRPFVALNMVSSADGKATVAGRTAPMSAEADRELFHHLRTQADGILVGAGTVRIERYGRVTKTAELQAERERAGVRPDALAVVVSASGQFPPDIPLLTDADQEVLVVPDLLMALKDLRTEHGIRSLLCEGGPTLNSTLFANNLVDELFLTVAPAVAGAGEALTIVEGAVLPATVELELLSVHEAGGHLFMRYRVG